MRLVLNVLAAPTLALSAFGILLLLAPLSGCGSGGAEPVQVIVRLARETPKLGGATLIVDYSGTGASPAERSGAPACTTIVPFVNGRFSDDGAGRLRIVVSSSRGFRGPTEIAACKMVPDSADTTGKAVEAALDVKVLKAEGLDGAVVKLDATSRRAAAPSASAGSDDAGRSDRDSAPDRPTVAPRPLDPTTKQTATARAKPAVPGRSAGAETVEPDATAPQPGEAPAQLARKPANSPLPKTVPSPTPPARGSRPLILQPGASSSSASAANSGSSAGSDNGAPSFDSGSGSDDDYDDSPADGDSADTFEYEVQVNLVRTPFPLGSLQFVLTHLGGRGGFVGRGSGVACDTFGDALSAANNPPGRSVNIGMISLQGINTGPVLSCIFSTSEVLTTRSFQIVVLDAANVEVQKAIPLPQLTVTQVRRL